MHEARGQSSPRSDGHIIGEAVLINLLNPKLTWMRRTFAASYAVLAGRLALADR